MSHVEIAQLTFYPVKGARGIDLPLADVQTTGLASGGCGDREWMVADANGRFVTQREFPRLALIEPSFARDSLVLDAPGRPSLHVLLDPANAPPARDVIVWRSEVRGRDEGERAARWLSDFLASPLRLVRFDRSKQRLCNPDFAGDSGAHTLFADGYPFLVIGDASLDELNARLRAKGEAALPMNRFRPNLVVSGLDAYDEDHLDTLAFGDVTLRLVKPCIRCQVTTTDQASAVVGIEPLPTLAAYRHNERLGGVAFGVNAIVASGAGTSLKVGAIGTATYRFDA